MTLDDDQVAIRGFDNLVGRHILVACPDEVRGGHGLHAAVHVEWNLNLVGATEPRTFTDEPLRHAVHNKLSSELGNAFINRTEEHTVVELALDARHRDHLWKHEGRYAGHP
jgi:hypothetical protein